jgi:predicted MPP superfamily phosphohydrolase
MSRKPAGATYMRMIVFGLVFTTALLLATWLAAGTWKLFLGLKSGWWVAAPLILALAYLPMLFAAHAFDNFAIRAGILPISILLGYLNYAFFAAITCWLVYGAARLVGRSPDMRLVACVFYGAAGLVAVGALVNAACIRTTRVTVRLDNLPDAWRGREVALVSDVHLGRILGRGFSERVVRHVGALSPDAVFVAGDIFDGPEPNPDAMLEPWKRLHPSKGIYFVTGNHDEFGDKRSVVDAVRRAGMRVLDDEKVTVEGMPILGVDDGDSRDREYYARILGGFGLQPGTPSILIVHQPTHLDIAEKAGVSLQLSGHTHGGQFWPWNLMVNRIYGPAAHGLSSRGGLQLYTSYGVGTWGPPMRFFTKPEIVLVRLENSASPAVSRE